MNQDQELQQICEQQEREGELTTSQETSEIYKALIKFQSEIQAVAKKTKNPFFNSNYADLSDIMEAIREPMTKAELGLIQAVKGNDKLVSRLIHSSGQFIECTMLFKAEKANMQGLGSAITYARRYSLSPLLGVSTEADDDGNSVSSGGSKASQAPQKEWLNQNTDKWKKVLEVIKTSSDVNTTIKQVRSKYSLSKENEKALRESV